ncbi:MAG: glycosyltransferase [Patescibacteria group bacterium]
MRLGTVPSRADKDMDERIKIVFGVNDFLVGGMQRQLTEQLKHFDTARFDIQVVTLFDFPDQQTLYHCVPSGFPVHRLSFSGWWDIGSWLELYDLMRGLSPDIVVSSLFFSNTVFRILKPFFPYVSIAREHNTYTDKPASQRLLDRMLARISYRIVAVSRTVADFTARQERIPREKFLVIHNGVDTAAARERLSSLPLAEETRRSLGFSSSDRILLSVSRLTPQKNLSLLVRSFARFRATHPGFRLAFVSDGPLRAELEREVESLGQTEAVRFFGYQEDVWPFYQVADALVSTSSIEGLSNAMLEALAAGVPLVATKTAGTDELIEEGKNGYFIKDASEDRAVETLTAYAAASRDALSEAAAETAERFSIQATVRAYEALFTECKEGVR